MRIYFYMIRNKKQSLKTVVKSCYYGYCLKMLFVQFFPLTSTNMGISPKNFLDFRFNPFPKLVYNFKAMHSASPILLSFNQGHPLKNWFFQSNPCNIEVMITSLIECQSYQTLVTSSHLQYNFRHVIGEIMYINYDVITFISKYLYFKKVQSSQFY